MLALSSSQSSYGLASSVSRVWLRPRSYPKLPNLLSMLNTCSSITSKVACIVEEWCTTYARTCNSDTTPRCTAFARSGHIMYGTFQLYVVSSHGAYKLQPVYMYMYKPLRSCDQWWRQIIKIIFMYGIILR